MISVTSNQVLAGLFVWGLVASGVSWAFGKFCAFAEGDETRKGEDDSDHGR